MEKYCVAYYDTFYRKEVKHYFDTLEDAIDFAKKQLNAKLDLLVKIYFEGK